jgi:Transglycosylase SLT domain/Domain of unknown function (DUF4124)
MSSLISHFSMPKTACTAAIRHKCIATNAPNIASANALVIATRGAWLLVFACLLIGFAYPAAANIYSFKDENGVTHFSNLPHLDKRYKLVYRIPDSWKTRPNAWTPNFPKSINIEKFVPIIDNAARAHGVDPRLVHAVIRAESGYNDRALSNKGAVGLMQLIPATAERMGVQNIYDPVENIFGGTRYLAFLLKTFNGDIELALAGYNAGEGAVSRYGNKIPPFAETQAYVPKVLSFYRSPELNRFVSQPLSAQSAQPKQPAQAAAPVTAAVPATTTPKANTGAAIERAPGNPPATSAASTTNAATTTAKTTTPPRVSAPSTAVSNTLNVAPAPPVIIQPSATR